MSDEPDYENISKNLRDILKERRRDILRKFWREEVTAEDAGRQIAELNLLIEAAQTAHAGETKPRTTTARIF
ncbi:hypothetical protein [Paracoccus sp. SY]|uniref:hypothetical protein n=1 Tax=Paracoccus sp. SY TaxID=1330255 RepID=UPI000CD0973A|nr:hypothetical protein [Paracoccus sp. SY]